MKRVSKQVQRTLQDLYKDLKNIKEFIQSVRSEYEDCYMYMYRDWVDELVISVLPRLQKYVWKSNIDKNHTDIVVVVTNLNRKPKSVYFGGGIPNQL
jgi:hypothetical protein